MNRPVPHPIALVLLMVAALGFASPELRAQAAETAADPGAADATGTAAAAVIESDRSSSLEEAYQREFAFLQGQKRELSQRLEQTRREAEQARSGLMREIARLEETMIETRTRADRLENLVYESERLLDAARENSDVLGATFAEAAYTLEGFWTREEDDAAVGADDVRQLFEAARTYLLQGHRTRLEPGRFFLADGTQVTGDLIRVGNVAAYGLSERGGGALAPAGDGELKLWDEAAEAVARELAAGTMPASLPVFLFESLNSEVERDSAKSVLETIQSGGVIGWIIVLLGLVGAVMVVLRIIFLRQSSASTDRLVSLISGHLRRGDRKAALELVKNHRGATARVLAATIRNLDRDREHIEDIVSEAILHESAHLNRLGAAIIVIAAVSPLLGLLGTVTGMIATFDVITEFGTGDPKLLSGGISIALVTTELGLIVAIPLLLLGNLLSGWSESIKDDMEKAALRVINLYSEQHRPEVAEAA